MSDKDAFVSPTKLNAMQKAENTHEAAMQIIDAEVSAREKKTERLRQARLEKEALASAAEDRPKRATKSTARSAK